MSRTLSYGSQLIEADDIAAVTRVLKGNYLTSGPAVAEFETGIRQVTGASEAIAVSSGTAALHLLYLALGIGPGDRVIVPAVTFLATANAARMVGADVVFADVDPETGLMEVPHLAAALDTPWNSDPGKTLICAVHLAGQCADLGGLRSMSDAAGTLLVEDACHALGTTYAAPDSRQYHVGACDHSLAACFSFHPVKTVAMGEGGMVTTNDPDLANKIRSLRNHGMTRDREDFQIDSWALDDQGEANPWYYEMDELGFNYRASDIHCALGLSQLSKLDRFADTRRKLVARYDSALAPFAPAIVPLGRKHGVDPVWHLYVALIDFAGTGVSRANVMNGLAKRNIGTQVHYIPVNRQPYYRRIYGEITLPGADAYYEKALSLPLHAGMTDQDIDRVTTALAGELGIAT